ncbi:MAG TPA: hypothetical protein VJU59_49375 [Paraburkholderia sp.]|uniref:hypothetical protein n=1 Tax=Paraburkholderia sp. TaxID=1926495 RepID=UPI002B45E501|nr:hypothetical protein [Paraburkholderia sp.]HKR47600.1 hypothetical protein [Paraburkholderia sp.]
MAKLKLGAASGAERPKAYDAFIARSRRFVESKGLSWNIPVNEDGSVDENFDWDLRVLTSSHARNAARTNGFAVEDSIRDCAIAAGWPAALLPTSSALGFEVQEFLKAVIAQRCKDGIVPRSVRNEALVYRRFFSATMKAPWELSTEDFDRITGLFKDTKAGVILNALTTLMNEKMLSLHVPLEPAFRTEFVAMLGTVLDERTDANKLPDPEALHELTRIVFCESPASHNDRLRFSVIRLLLFTGLRLNEVLMLPLDCLRWETHMDVVTGLPAGEVGGTSRTLQLRFFGLKREEGRPDLLVEDHQWVPEKFHSVIAEAVKIVQEATAPLREVLRRNLDGVRQFKTSAGQVLSTADLLFITMVANRDELPAVIPEDAVIETLSESGVYFFMGWVPEGRTNMFMRYGKTSNCRSMTVNPHSLRHLMNTEFFRLNIPDTIITQHFGRQTVTQSYEYDHRSLAERLSFVQLPPSAVKMIVPGTPQEVVAKMVVGGFASNSHIAQSFKKIQAEHGDDAAFEYLVTNSDGFHVTPYGFCTTSFALNPCARHLKCFHRCKQFVASGLREHTVSLEQLRSKLVSMKKVASAKPANSIGRKNQIEHAEQLLAGVDAALKAKPGDVVFENGQDHSEQATDLFA